MKVIHVLRKPCSESPVAANVLKHGTGALNVNGCRVEGAPRVPGTVRPGGAPSGAGSTLTGNSRDRQMAYAAQPPEGRWPANIVLQHLGGCRCEGTKEVKPPNESGRAGAGSLEFQTLYVGGVAKGADFAGGSVKTDGT